MSSRRRLRGTTVGLVGLGAYGASMTAAGVLLALTSAQAAPQGADGGPGARALQEARVIAPGASSVPAGSRTPAAGPVPVAPDGRAAPGQAEPFRPTGIVLPSGSRALVEQVGVHPDGAMVIPPDPREVGWWNGGALAGEPFGSIVLAGHVDSRRFGRGVLAELKAVRVGDVVSLGAGARTVRYRVVGTERVRQARLAGDVGYFDQDVPHRLVLITCGGAFDPVRHRYTDNLVILADPVP